MVFVQAEMNHVLFDTGLWIATRDGDPRAFAVFRRHYSFQKYADGRRHDPSYRNRFLFCGPGEKCVLVTPSYDALWVWRKFIDDSGQIGVNCAVFRNEGAERSSALIIAAEDIGWRRWPRERFYTYVDDAKLPAAKRPGYCFECAGWTRIKERTKSGKLIFEKLP